MASQVVPIENIDKFGFIADSPSIALAPGAFSDVLNVRFDNGAIRKVKGYVEIFETLNLTNIIKIAYWPNPNKPIWVVVNRQGTPEKDHIFAISLDSTNTLTATNVSANTTNGYTISDNWQATLFNGGYSIILNPGNDTPQHSTDTQGSTSIPAFANLPNWDSYTAGSTTVAKVYCGIIIPLGNLLLAGDLQEFDSSNNIIRDLRGVVRSSDVAAPGTIPQNWNPFATGAGTADEIIIADTGRIKAMKPLQGKVMVYTSDSISELSVSSTGLSELKITDQYGAINQECVYEYDGRHIVLGSNDIYSFEGHPASIKSLADGRVRRYYYNDVHGSSTNLTRIVRDLSYDELWICYRTNNNTTETLDQALTWNYRNNVWSKRSLPNLNDIWIGSITGGGVDKTKFTINVTGSTGTTTAGTAEVQTTAITGADGLTGGVQEVQQATITGTRSNVVGDQNEIYNFNFPSNFNSGTFTPIPTGSTYDGTFVTSKTVTVNRGTSGNLVTSNLGDVTGLSVTKPRSKYIYYTYVYAMYGVGYPGSVNPNTTSFSYPWHNRTFYGNQTGWGTSHVRETDNQVSQCHANPVSCHRLQWRYTSGSGYVQNPYYFTFSVTGKHRTSTTGAFLTGTHWYTTNVRGLGSLGGAGMTKSFGQAEAFRHSAFPGYPGSTAMATGSSIVQSGIYYLYDLRECQVQWYFNSNQPSTSNAHFGWEFVDNPNGYIINNQTNGSITFDGTTVAANTIADDLQASSTSATSFTLSSQAPTTFDFDLDAGNSGVFAGTVSGYFEANTNATAAAVFIKDAVNAKGYSGVTATRTNNIVCTVDTGQASNLSGSMTVVAGTGAVNTNGNLSSQNGFSNPTFATTYTIKAPDEANTVINTFTSSVADLSTSDLANVKFLIADKISQYTDVSNNRNLDFTLSGASIVQSSPYVITNGRAGVTRGLFVVESDNQGAGVNEAGNIAFSAFTRSTTGVDGGSVTGTVSLGSSSDDFYIASTPFTASNSLSTASTNNSMSSDIAIAINNVLSQWTVASATNSNNVTLTDTTSRNITQFFSIAGNRSDTGTITVATPTRTTNGIDFTTAGSIVSTITPTTGSIVTLTTPIDNKTQNQCATLLAAELDARNEFIATVVNNNTVEVETTQFGNASPDLQVVFNSGTILSGDDAVEPTHTFTEELLTTRDIERPWPTTFINEDFNFLVGVTNGQFFAFDLGSEAGAIAAVNISNITQANPGVVTTASPHNLTTGQEVSLSGVEGMTQVNGIVYYAKVLTSTTFTLCTDVAMSYSVDTSSFSAYTTGGQSLGSAGKILSYIERKNIHVSPTKDTENYVSFYMDTEGESNAFDVRLQMTNAAGQQSDLTSTSTSATTYNFTYGGDTANYDVDTRLNGRIANYRVEDNSRENWAIAAIGFEFDKGGTR